jgi:hypothetical protein
MAHVPQSNESNLRHLLVFLGDPLSWRWVAS